MGYTTEFEGEIRVDRKIKKKTRKLLEGLANTRRMKRDIEGYGIEGEFYIDGNGFMGQEKDSTVMDYNNPPSTQPGLWLQWVVGEDKQSIVWDGAEKFYYAEEWMTYIIDKILAPEGYILNGEIVAQGEEISDRWVLKVKNNKVKRKDLK